MAIFSPPIEGPDLERLRRLIKLGVVRVAPDNTRQTPQVRAAVRKWRAAVQANPTIRPKRKK